MLLVPVVDNRRKTEYFETLLRYLAATIRSEKKPDLKDEPGKVIEQGDEFMTTIAEKWVQEGIEKGIKKRDIEVTQKMIERNMSDTDIQAITGLSLSRIIEIRKKMRS